MSWPEAPQLPSVAVPERILLPEPTLEVPEAELPKYPPLVVPPSNLQPPPGIEGINEDPPPEEDQETKAPASNAGPRRQFFLDLIPEKTKAHARTLIRDGSRFSPRMLSEENSEVKILPNSSLNCSRSL